MTAPIDPSSPRTIDWRDGAVVIIDQTALPQRERLLELRTVAGLIEAIQRLAVRGAPALGVAGALGVALVARQAEAESWSRERSEREIQRLRSARPTAANLAWGVDQVSPLLGAGPAAVEQRAIEVLEADVRVNRQLARRGADLLAGADPRPLRLHTHCNAGALACVEWGTALGVIRALHERGLVHSVLVDETRPLLQGARLTAWELGRMGVEHRLVCDGAGPAAIAQGLVDAVLVGADRIAANGDVANKIGTYALALATQRADVPFVVAAPEATIDPSAASGAEIAIELRGEEEVLGFAGLASAPAGTRALNPAFDITPADLVTAIVTEDRVIRVSAGERPDSGVPGGSRDVQLPAGSRATRGAVANQFRNRG